MGVGLKKMGMLPLLVFTIATVILLLMPGCLAKPDDGSAARGAGFCAPLDQLERGAGPIGSAKVFDPDPTARAGDQIIGPSSLRLDDFRVDRELARLTGQGVLSGLYVDVRDGLNCGGSYGAFSRSQSFSYPHSDSRFQEATAYYAGDAFRAMLASAGALGSEKAIRIIANCPESENAYFTRGRDSSGQLVEYVCLGISAATPGASYADDGVVTVHELQHATTAHAYSPVQRLGTLWYDEAGALNEGISDFLGLVYAEPLLATGQDPRLFGRWSLGSFIPNSRHVRGAHRCPEYDPSFPACTGYPQFAAASNTVSYVYPDGMGWPFADNTLSPGKLREIFTSFSHQEEIHNGAPIIEGALWDAYAAIRDSRANAAQARALMARALVEAVRQLPRPSSANVSPANFRTFAARMVEVAPIVGFGSSDESLLVGALTERGLYGDPGISDGQWAAVGSGEIRVVDQPITVKSWIAAVGGDPSVVKHGISTGLNSRLDAGEVAAIWFDVKNLSPVTAGAVLLKVNSLSPYVEFVDSANLGFISDSEAQVSYAKINGTGIVSALSLPANPTFHVPAGNSYFKTNPFYESSPVTALFVRVSAAAPHGETIAFEVRAEPSNGVPSTVIFSAVLP